MNVRLYGLFTTRSPLSHIGETLSTTTYLVEEPILQPDGSLESVFSYSGNAWRGQLRDLSSIYLLEHLGSPRVPLETFHLLFSGGRIGGEQKTDIRAARNLRAQLPHLSIFGGGVGNQILAGKLRVSNAYPVCQEALPVLPPEFHAPARVASYRGMTFEKSLSRRDDSKDVRFAPHLVEDAALLSGPESGKKAAPDVATQMRMTSELLVAGVSLYSEVDAMDVSEVELGCLTAALHLFSRSPVIGGQGNRGHGRVTLDYRLLNLDTGADGEFISIQSGAAPLLSEAAQSAKSAYDQHLRAQYDAFLGNARSEIRAVLGAPDEAKCSSPA